MNLDNLIGCTPLQRPRGPGFNSWFSDYFFSFEISTLFIYIHRAWDHYGNVPFKEVKLYMNPLRRDDHV